MALPVARKLPLVPTKAPNLLVSPVEFSQQYFEMLMDALRLYFNDVDNTVYGLINAPEVATVAALVNGTAGTVLNNITNAASITKNGTGDYTLNFTRNLVDTQYAPLITLNGIGFAAVITPSVNSVTFRTYNSAGVLTDFSYISVVVFGGGLL